MVDTKPTAIPMPIDRAERTVPNARGTTAHVYQAIRKAIADRTFEPGQQLQEAFLADWLGVSRTPVREALRHLERDGLVVPKHARGVVVAQVTIEDISHGYLLLEVLEGLAARLAAQRIDDDQARQLAVMLDEMRDAVATGDYERWATVDADLHERVRSIAECRKLSELTALVYPVLDRVRNMYLLDGGEPDVRSRLMALHLGMGEAILARDAERAETLARALFAEGGEACVALLRRWISPLRRSF
jgi:DNA-binding GntR family transcriptional regulator